MMKQYKKELIVSTLLALLPIAAGLLLWNRLPGQLASGAVKQSVEEGGRLPARPGVVDRRADDDSVEFVQPLCQAVHAVVKDAALAAPAFSAGDAARDRLCADLHQLRLDAVLLQGLCNLG